MATQDFSIGSTVKVGFMSLVVKAKVATPGDYAPDAYILVNAPGTQLYRFVPHRGVEKITVDEARDMIAEVNAYAAQAASWAIAKAQAARDIDALFA